MYLLGGKDEGRMYQTHPGTTLSAGTSDTTVTTRLYDKAITQISMLSPLA